MKTFRPYRRFLAEYRFPETSSEKLEAGAEKIGKGVKDVLGAAVRHGFGGEVKAKEAFVDPGVEIVKGAGKVAAGAAGAGEKKPEEEKNHKPPETPDESREDFIYGGNPDIKTVDAKTAQLNKILAGIRGLILKKFSGGIPGELYVSNQGVLVLDVMKDSKGFPAAHFYAVAPDGSLEMLSEMFYKADQKAPELRGIVTKPLGEAVTQEIGRSIRHIVDNIDSNSKTAWIMGLMARPEGIKDNDPKKAFASLGTVLPKDKIEFLLKNRRARPRAEKPAVPTNKPSAPTAVKPPAPKPKPAPQTPAATPATPAAKPVAPTAKAPAAPAPTKK